MTRNLRDFLERFPEDWTIGKVLDLLEDEEDQVQEANIRCVHANCGRLITRSGRERWTHVAPDGSTSRSCRSASFDDPKPGDEAAKQEWLDWPRSQYRQYARPPRK